MASPQASEKLFANQVIQMWDHDPDGTSAAVVTPDAGTTERWVDMRDAESFAVLAMSSTLTGAGITLLEIVAADDTAGTNITVIKTSGAVVADAVGDYVVEECTASEVRQESEDAGATLRYVAGRITVANSADEAVVTYIRSGLRFANSGDTADTIA
jgi:hypothetical protein